MAMGRGTFPLTVLQKMATVLLLAGILADIACSTLPVGRGAEPPVMAARSAVAPSDIGHVLESGKWVLLELNGAVVHLPAGGRQPYLLFEPQDGRLTGYSACNEFTGNYVVQGDSLSFGVFGMTRRYCADASGDVEQVFLGVLSKTRNWRVEQQMLLILEGDRVLARLRQELRNIQR